MLEFLEVVFVGAALDEVVDVEEIPLGGDVEASVLLADAAVTTGGEGAGRGVWPHALGAGPRVHLLLVERHPFRVRVGRHGLLGGSLGEDGAGADVAVDGESVVGHLLLLLLLDEGGSSKVSWAKWVQRLWAGGGAGTGVVGDGP